MIRGTTPIIKIKIKNPDFDMSTIDFAHISIENAGGKNNKVFEDTVIDTEEKTISYHLTQEDTLGFEVGPLSVQMKGKLLDGNIISHDPIITTMKKIQEETIL